jgi:hypothetical protein
MTFSFKKKFIFLSTYWEWSISFSTVLMTIEYLHISCCSNDGKNKRRDKHYHIKTHWIYLICFVSHTNPIKECVDRSIAWLIINLNHIRWQSSPCLCNSRIVQSLLFSQHTFVIKLECRKRKKTLLTHQKKKTHVCLLVELSYIYIYWFTFGQQGIYDSSSLLSQHHLNTIVSI